MHGEPAVHVAAVGQACSDAAEHGRVVAVRQQEIVHAAGLRVEPSGVGRRALRGVVRDHADIAARRPRLAARGSARSSGVMCNECRQGLQMRLSPGRGEQGAVAADSISTAASSSSPGPGRRNAETRLTLPAAQARTCASTACARSTPARAAIRPVVEGAGSAARRGRGCRHRSHPATDCALALARDALHRATFGGVEPRRLRTCARRHQCIACGGRDRLAGSGSDDRTGWRRPSEIAREVGGSWRCIIREMDRGLGGGIEPALRVRNAVQCGQVRECTTGGW